MDYYIILHIIIILLSLLSQSLQFPQMWLVHKLLYFALNNLQKFVIRQYYQTVGCNQTPVTRQFLEPIISSIFS